MADMSTIAAFLGSIKHATDLAKALRDVGVSLDKAEAKLKMADLIEALADTRIRAAELQEDMQEQAKEIGRLQEAFRIKDTLIRANNCYYTLGDDGKPSGDPYCSLCWEGHQRAIHLVVGSHGLKISCPACHTVYDKRKAWTI